MKVPPYQKFTIILIALLWVNTSYAQFTAHYANRSDNACKLIYLVNPSPDSVFYIAGLEQKDINDCQSFNHNALSTGKIRVNISNKEKGYLLLLPKDTIIYKILIPADMDNKDKELFLLSRYSPSVIPTNKDKKRNRQIKRLPGRWIAVPVSENR